MPSRSAELAILGGRPAFAVPLHVGRPNVGDPDRMRELVTGALERRWLTNDGPLVAEFEIALAPRVGGRHRIAVANGTVGIQLAAKAMGLSGEVIMPSFTFVGTAHALAWVGVEPVFCEIDPATHMLDPAAVERAITPRTSGILGVHLWGRPCDVGALEDLARRHELRLLFDAAHALGCSHDGRRIGGFGDAEVFSFHATKVANAAEGGAITTDDEELASRLRLMRNFGFSDFDEVSVLGTNAKLSELNAAMGLASLESLDEFIAVNRRNHAAYGRGLDGIDGVSVLRYDASDDANFHYVVIELDERLVERLPRDALVAALQAENVLARRYFYPGCHRMAPYAAAGASLPVTESVAARVVVLPNGTSVDERAAETICEIVRAAVERAEDVRRALRS
jgi:dTDP-4-amino-4,6-dideoxygalactose transaminase